jgi:translation initiation factor 1
MKARNSRPVYSTESGRLCPDCGAAKAACRCRRSPAKETSGTGDGIVRLHRESKGRGGKPVTLIRGLALAEPDMKQLAKQLKQRCGVGGAVKNGCIEIQGDQRELLLSLLEERGFRVKIAGG